MIVGHFGLAATVKSRATYLPLWILMLATVWLDVVFAPLFAAGIEKLEPLAGTDGGYGENVIHADYTHSLVGALVLSVLFGAVCARWWGRTGGIVLAAVVFSHWVLDLLVHRADLPLLPGNAGDLPVLGLGLWRYPAVTVTMEVGLLVLGGFLYWRAARRVADGPRATRVVAAIVASGIVVIALDFLVPA